MAVLRDKGGNFVIATILCDVRLFSGDQTLELEV